MMFRLRMFGKPDNREMPEARQCGNLPAHVGHTLLRSRPHVQLVLGLSIRLVDPSGPIAQRHPGQNAVGWPGPGQRLAHAGGHVDHLQALTADTDLVQQFLDGLDPSGRTHIAGFEMAVAI